MPAQNPYALQGVRTHPLARMLPLYRWQEQVYRLGEKLPPGLAGYAPKWECVSVQMGGRTSGQVRVNLENDFHLLAVACRSSALGGFRGQLFDVAKKVRLADRGVLATLMGGGPPGVVFLREPYRFDQPGSQLLAMVQNLAAGANLVQIALYGVCLRRDETGGGQ